MPVGAKGFLRGCGVEVFFLCGFCEKEGSAVLGGKLRLASWCFMSRLRSVCRGEVGGWGESLLASLLCVRVCMMFGLNLSNDGYAAWSEGKKKSKLLVGWKISANFAPAKMVRRHQRC